MIVEFLAELLLVFVGGIFEALPEFELANITASGGMVLYYNTLNQALPLGEMTALFGTSMLFRAWAAAWHGAVFLYRLIPFV